MTLSANDLVAVARSRILEISPAELHGWRDRGHLLIDVREPGEFATGHLPGAINLPRGVIEFQIDAHPAMACTTSDALARKSRSLVVYCLSGGRAALAADSLQRLGFDRVQSLAGGIVAWREAGLPIVIA